MAWREKQGVRTLFSMPLLCLWIAGHVCCITSVVTNTTSDSRRKLGKSLNLEWPCCWEFLTYSPYCNCDKKVLHKNALSAQKIQRKASNDTDVRQLIWSLRFFQMAFIWSDPYSWLVTAWLVTSGKSHPFMPHFSHAHCIYPVLGELKLGLNSPLRAGWHLTANCILEFHLYCILQQHFITCNHLKAILRPE